MSTKTVVNCTTGETSIVEFTADEIAAAAAATEARDLNFSSVRAERNGLLSSSDWTQAVDSPLTDAKKAKWATYRQELRDYPSTASKVSELGAWPTEPS